MKIWISRTPRMSRTSMINVFLTLAVFLALGIEIALGTALVPVAPGNGPAIFEQDC